MTFKKFVSALCCAALWLACFSCSPPSGEFPGGGDYAGGDFSYTDDNSVESVDPDTATHDFVLVSAEDGTLIYECSDCEETRTTYITCNGGTEGAYSAEGTAVTFSGISEPSVYDVRGELYGNIVIDAGDDGEFELAMSGFTLYSHDACPIVVRSGDKVTLSAKNSTENLIFDMRAAVSANDADAISSSVYALCDLDIQGKGKLSVKSVNNNGIHAKGDLKVKNLTLQVDCLDNALKGNDGVTAESGSVTLISRGGDGIKTSNSDVSKKGKQHGAVRLTGGNMLIYAACDGIDSAYDVIVNESTASLDLQIFTERYSKYTVGASSRSYVSQFNFGPGGMGGPGGGMGGIGGGPGGFGGMDEGNSDKSDVSSKGIKACNAIVISAGNATVNSYDDALHADTAAALENGETPSGNIELSGGTLTLKSNDDGVHADGSVLISGGELVVASSYEGIEGSTVEISGGSVYVTSSDDGVNGTASSGTAITVSGGKLYVYAGGDGLDSNSASSYAGIRFSGGYTVAISTGQADSSIDTEQGYSYTGGYVLGIGRSGGMGSEAVNCKGFSSVGTSKNVTVQKDAYLAVDGLVAVKMPVSMSCTVVCLGKTKAAVSVSASAGYETDVAGVWWQGI